MRVDQNRVRSRRADEEEEDTQNARADTESFSVDEPRKKGPEMRPRVETPSPFRRGDRQGEAQDGMQRHVRVPRASGSANAAR